MCSSFQQHLLTNIHTESEGIVRKAYCLLISHIYRDYTISSHLYELIFPTMAHIAVHDLYWEAKMSALHFWHTVLLRQFKYNGVIGGGFPAVTFSKRDKKIVTLTPKEIDLRLHIIFKELQARGALGVILECLNDQCDLQVVIDAQKVGSEIEKFLAKYNFRKDETSSLSDLSLRESKSASDARTVAAAAAAARARQAAASDASPRQSVLFMPPKEQLSDSGAAADDVIETIVALDDINLLGDTAIKEQQAGSTAPDASPFLDPKFFQKIKEVGTEEYLKRIADIELDTLIERRSAWLTKNESFGSLLDDMMFSLQIGDANNADCY